MSEETLTTWTDEQVQAQLDLWASQIEQGATPEMKLTGHYPYYNPFERSLDLTLYTLQFDEHIIKLTSEQSQHVDEWMNTHRFQFQLNRFKAICKEISSQNQQQEDAS
jgi:hypothetical protein